MSDPFNVPSTPPARQRSSRNSLHVNLQPPTINETNTSSSFSLNPNSNSNLNSNLDLDLKTPLRSNAGLLTPTTTTKRKQSVTRTSLHPPTSAAASSSSSSSYSSSLPFSSNASEKNAPAIAVSKFSLSPTTPQELSSIQHNEKSHATTRKRNLNDIFMDNRVQMHPSEKLSFGLFLPSPSTIGSGRTNHHSHSHKSQSGKSLSVPLFDRKKLESLRVQEEEDVAMEEDLAKEPSTPGKQIIDDVKIKQWHGKSFNKYDLDSSDGEEEEENEEKAREKEQDFADGRIMTLEQTKSIPRARLPNPFLEDTKVKQMNKKLDREVRDEKTTVNYNTHMELYNNKTGERKVLKLTKSQMKYKPKKLTFEGL